MKKIRADNYSKAPRIITSLMPVAAKTGGNMLWKTN